MCTSNKNDGKNNEKDKGKDEDEAAVHVAETAALHATETPIRTWATRCPQNEMPSVCIIAFFTRGQALFVTQQTEVVRTSISLVLPWVSASAVDIYDGQKISSLS